MDAFRVSCVIPSRGAMMNYFQIVKAALDTLVDGICRHRGLQRPQAMQMAAAQLQAMSAEWFSGERPNIAYGDPLCRFAYLYCHTSVNANLCEHCIRGSADICDLINRSLNATNELRICAFGGGPGTELLAFAKHLCNTRAGQQQGDISFTLLDIVPEWAESWNALETAIKARLRQRFGPRTAWPFTTSKTFQPFDMTHVDQYANLNQLFEQELYVLNYVLSEIFSDHQALGQLITRMAQAAPAGAKFLIVDRAQTSVMTWAQEILQAAGLVVGQIQETSRNMDGEEQSAALEEYTQLIGRRPRVQWRGAFWVVGTKP